MPDMASKLAFVTCDIRAAHQRWLPAAKGSVVCASAQRFCVFDAFRARAARLSRCDLPAGAHEAELRIRAVGLNFRDVLNAPRPAQLTASPPVSVRVRFQNSRLFLRCFGLMCRPQRTTQTASETADFVGGPCLGRQRPSAGWRTPCIWPFVAFHMRQRVRVSGRAKVVVAPGPH